MYFHKLKMEEDALIVCTKWGNSPCLVRLMGEELIDDGERHKRSNDVGNRQVSFRLYRSFTRQMYGVLGKGNRVPPAKCIQSMIKNKFPDKDDSEFLGYRSD